MEADDPFLPYGVILCAAVFAQRRVFALVERISWVCCRRTTSAEASGCDP